MNTSAIAFDRHGSVGVDRQYDPAARAIEQFGYSAVEAAFLCRALKAGGYFMRRQFLAFADQRMGQLVVDFTRRLERKGHATATALRQGTRVYHLASRSLYTAAGCEDRKRVRRRRPPASIKARLMALDVILANPNVRFLATLEDRLAWLERVLPGDDWLPRRPSKTRPGGPTTTQPFAENVMIGVPVDVVRLAAPWFVYLEGGGAPVAGFGACLRRYQALLVRLGTWRVVYVTDAERHAVRAIREYRYWAGVDERGRCTVDSVDIDTLLEHFRFREAYEAERWSVFLTTPMLDRFGAVRRRLKGEADGLYARWLHQGDAAVRKALTAADGSSTLGAATTFETVVMSHAYPFDPAL